MQEEMNRCFRHKRPVSPGYGCNHNAEHVQTCFLSMLRGYGGRTREASSHATSSSSPADVATKDHFRSASFKAILIVQSRWVAQRKFLTQTCMGGLSACAISSCAQSPTAKLPQLPHRAMCAVACFGGRLRCAVGCVLACHSPVFLRYCGLIAVGCAPPGDGNACHTTAASMSFSSIPEMGSGNCHSLRGAELSVGW